MSDGRSAGSSPPATPQAFWPEDEWVTFVVIVRGIGQNGQPTEVIEPREAQHDAFQAARTQGLQKAYAG